ncbi:TauD/TfdA family dioxygenase [Aurantivibrio plasticivorans]
MLIETKAAWTPQSVADIQDQWKHTLTEQEIGEIISATDKWVLEQRPLEELNQGNFILPTLGERLKNIASDLENGLGFYMLTGLPVNDFNYEELCILYAGMGTYMGTPIAQSVDNELVHDVYSKGESLTSEKGRGTQTCDYLPFHTDRADIVALLCLQQSKDGGQSQIVSAVSIYNEIAQTRPDLLAVLCQNFNNIRAPWEPKVDGPTYQIPIFSIYEGQFACRYLRNFIHYAQQVEGIPDLTAQQIEALDLVDSLCADPRFRLDIDFDKGDIQFINNFVTLHGRAAYSEYDQPHMKRFLLRLWLSSPISRPLSPLFKPLYGNVAAGSLRGGMLAQTLATQCETETA